MNMLKLLPHLKDDDAYWFAIALWPKKKVFQLLQNNTSAKLIDFAFHDPEEIIKAIVKRWPEKPHDKHPWIYTTPLLKRMRKLIEAEKLKNKERAAQKRRPRVRVGKP